MKQFKNILMTILILAAVCIAVVVPAKFFQSYDNSILNSLNTEAVNTTELYRNSSLSVADRLKMIYAYGRDKNISRTDKTDTASDDLTKEADSLISTIKILQALDAFPQTELKSSDVVSIQKTTSTYTDSTQPDIYVKTVRNTLLMRNGDITLVTDPDTNTVYEYIITLPQAEMSSILPVTDLVGSFSKYLGVELYNIAQIEDGPTLFQSKDQTIEYTAEETNNSVSVEFSDIN